MAFTAASEISCGVSKSGSPALSPITGKPARRRSLAFAVMANVADGLMESTRGFQIEATFPARLLMLDSKFVRVADGFYRRLLISALATGTGTKDEISPPH